MVMRNGVEWGDDVPNLGPDTSQTEAGREVLPGTYNLVGVTCAQRGCFLDDGQHGPECVRNN